MVSYHLSPTVFRQNLVQLQNRTGVLQLSIPFMDMADYMPPPPGFSAISQAAWTENSWFVTSNHQDPFGARSGFLCPGHRVAGHQHHHLINKTSGDSPKQTIGRKKETSSTIGEGIKNSQKICVFYAFFVLLIQKFFVYL